MIDNKKEYILCAAIKRVEPKLCSPYYNNDICNIEIGFRHHDILQRFQGEVSKNSNDQGFYTSIGRYVSRCEAMMIAWLANQVDDNKALKCNKCYIEQALSMHGYKYHGDIFKKYFNNLYSEDLY